MENKIQELTDKIYREGVEKGNEEAQRLIANAQEEAKKIIDQSGLKVYSAIQLYEAADLVNKLLKGN